MLLNEELIEYIIHGKEETYLEYKSSMPWISGKKAKVQRSKKSNYRIIKSMLALSNNPNGGVIVIGVKEKKNGEYYLQGVSQTNYNTFKHDDVARMLKGICAPEIVFKINRGEMLVGKKRKKFVVIQVQEASEMPIICTRTEKINDSAPEVSSNLILRENVIYIRSKAPIESREIASVHEWQELIYQVIKRSELSHYNRKKYFEKADKSPPAFLTVGDLKKFESQLGSDNL